jgi:hypothetical protein
LNLCGSNTWSQAISWGVAVKPFSFKIFVVQVGKAEGHEIIMPLQRNNVKLWLLVKPKNKESIPFLKQLLNSLSVVQSVEVIKPANSRTRKSLESGLKEVKDMVSGKKKGKTLKQLLDED